MARGVAPSIGLGPTGPPRPPLGASADGVPGPANLAYHEANIACLRAAGFTPKQVAHAYAIVDAFVYGFVLQEATLPFESGDEAAAMIEQDAFGEALASYPNMVWFTQEVILVSGYSFTREFEPGLDLVLDGIEARFTTPR